MADHNIAPAVEAPAIEAIGGTHLAEQLADVFCRQLFLWQRIDLLFKAGIGRLFHEGTEAVYHFDHIQITHILHIGKTEIFHTLAEHLCHIHAGAASITGIVTAKMAELMGKGQFVLLIPGGIQENKGCIIAADVDFKGSIGFLIGIRNIVESIFLHCIKGFFHGAAHRRGHLPHISQGGCLIAQIHLRIHALGDHLPVQRHQLRLDICQVSRGLVAGIVPVIVIVIGKFRIAAIAQVGCHFLTHRHQLHIQLLHLLAVILQKFLRMGIHPACFAPKGKVFAFQGRFLRQKTGEYVIIEAFAHVIVKESRAEVVISFKLCPERTLSQFPVQPVQRSLGNGSIFRAEGIFFCPVRIR